MKRIVTQGLVLVLGLSAVIAGALWLIGPEPVSMTGDASSTVVESIPVSPAKSEKVVQAVKPAQQVSLRQSDWKASAKTNSQDRLAEIADEALLDKVIQEVLDELSVAKASGNSARILELVRKLRSLDYGAKSSRFSRGASAAALKLRVLDALSSLGAAGAIEAVALVGDTEPSIAQRATDVLFEGLQDFTMGDRTRAEIIVAASEEMTDSNNLLRLYQEFIKMRHSVGAEALAAISQSGTSAAKEQLPRVISSFTHDVTITEASQLEAWLNDNPDAEQDEWFYGPKQIPNQDTSGQ